MLDLSHLSVPQIIPPSHERFLQVVLLCVMPTNVGAHPAKLCAEVIRLWDWCILGDIYPVVLHLAGQNTIADCLNRHSSQIYEWSLKDQLIQSIFSSWGQQDMDLFAMSFNKKCCPFYSSADRNSQSISDAFILRYRKGPSVCSPPPASFDSEGSEKDKSG